MSIRVVVAEGDPLIAEGLAQSLNHDSDLQTRAVVEPAGALEMCLEWRPCVLLVGEALFERMDPQRFLEVTGWGRVVQALVVGAVADPELSVSCLRLGCMGYLSRQNSLETLHKAIRAVAAGEMWAHRSVLTKLLRELLDERLSPPRLTHRQREILDLIHAGCNNDQITARLFISAETLRWHLRRLFQAIGAPSRAAALAFARRHFVAAAVADRGGGVHHISSEPVGKNQLASGISIG